MRTRSVASGVAFGAGLAILLAACGSVPTPATKREVRLLTGTKNRYYYNVGLALKEAARAHNIEIKVVESNGSYDNIVEMESGRAQLALVQSDVAHRAWHGEKPFRTPSDNAKVIAPLFIEKVHILTRPHLYVSSPRELRNKKLWVGASGSGSEATALTVLEASGVPQSELDVLRAANLSAGVSYDQAVELLNRGELDAVFQTSVTPADRISRLLSSSEVHLLGFEWELVEKLVSDGSYIETSLQRVDYAGVHQATLTVGVQALLLCREDTDPEVVKTLAAMLQFEKTGIEASLEGIQDQPGVMAPSPSTLTLLGRKPKEQLQRHAHNEAKPYLYDWPIQKESIIQVALLFAALCLVGPRGLALPWTGKAALRKLLMLTLCAVVLWLIGAVWLKEIEGGVNEHFASLWRSAGSLARSIAAKLPFPVPWEVSSPTTPSGKSAMRYFTWIVALMLILLVIPNVKKFWQERLKPKSTPTPA